MSGIAAETLVIICMISGIKHAAVAVEGGEMSGVFPR